jgi:ubiquinone/menaquinone biosynthesis C-methylase UbiE
MPHLCVFPMAHRRGLVNLNGATRAAYEHWAPLYPPRPHNPLMRAEQCAMSRLLPEVAGSQALDLAAGSGRYSQLLRESRAEHVVALDFCRPMLAQVSDASRVCGNMLQLPFRDESFDVVVSGLALGHAADVFSLMSEMARVLRKGGRLLYSDFHPAASQNSMTRSFTDECGQSWTVPHHRHDLATQHEALAASGLTLEAAQEVRAGHEMREEFSGSEQFYRRWHGLPLVLVIRARK